MSRLEPLLERAADRPVTTVFVLLITGPLIVAGLSFRQPIALPDALLTELEWVFWLLVYMPVSAIRRLLFDPLGLERLFGVPVLGQGLIVLTLGGLYYLVSYFLVYAGSALLGTAETDAGGDGR
ncbi:hypothetical protein [Natrialba asiatica]|uniref:hypothetical protein n=1 Tax=Natrialba asiatica TaxID=64602 RepID=UPI000A854353|nr:hypothetical protein [Natrialba asiatica]